MERNYRGTPALDIQPGVQAASVALDARLPRRIVRSPIERCRQVIVEGEITWQRFFALNAIAPVQVIFEQLTSDYSGEVRHTLQRIRPASRSCHRCPRADHPATGGRAVRRAPRRLHRRARAPYRSGATARAAGAAPRRAARPAEGTR